MSLLPVIDAVSAAVAADSANAQVQVRTINVLVSGTATQVSVQAGAHVLTVDEPPSLGGEGAAPSPVEYALAALGSCQVITYQFWAARLGVRLDTVAVDVEGDLDVRGFFGLDDRTRPGFTAVRVRVRLSGPEPRHRYDELTRLVDEHCPVLDLFANSTAVTTRLEVLPNADAPENGLTAAAASAGSASRIPS